MVKDVKMAIRERIWRLMEERGVAAFPRPVYGRIPNFRGPRKHARIWQDWTSLPKPPWLR